MNWPYISNLAKVLNLRKVFIRKVPNGCAVQSNMRSANCPYASFKEISR
jgi:hypothetical protein